MKRYRVTFKTGDLEKSLVVNAEDEKDAGRMIRSMVAIEWPERLKDGQGVEILSCEEEKEEARRWT